MNKAAINTAGELFIEKLHEALVCDVPQKARVALFKAIKKSSNLLRASGWSDMMIQVEAIESKIFPDGCRNYLKGGVFTLS